MPDPWDNATEECIEALGAWIEKHAPASYTEYQAQYNNATIRTPLQDLWNVSELLDEWAEPVVPTADPDQFQRIYAIRTNALEQNNHLIYVSYLDDQDNSQLGIVRKMAPSEVSNFFWKLILIHEQGYHVEKLFYDEDKENYLKKRHLN